MAIPVILDTDIGGDIDDVWALAMLLHSPELKLLALTTVTGDTRYRAQIAAKLIMASGHPAIPLGMGPLPEKISPLVYSHAAALDGNELEQYPGEITDDAADLIIRTVKASREPVTLIGIGPFGNIAEVVRRAPELVPQIRFLGVGGSIYKQYFNKPGHCPEYNVNADIPAARAAFAAPWKAGFISPVDTCGNVFLRGERYRRVQESALPEARLVMAFYQAFVDFRRANFAGEGYRCAEHDSGMIADPAIITLAVHPEWAEYRTLPVAVDDAGETLVEPAHGTPVKLALNWREEEKFLDFVTDRTLKEYGSR